MNLIAAPILIPLLAAAVSLFFHRSPGAQRMISGVVSLLLPVLSVFLLLWVRANGVAVLRVGDWPDAFGIVFAVDLFGAIMLCLSSIVQAVTWAFIVGGGVHRDGEKFLIHPLFLLLCAGVNWSFTTGDLFNLFVSFEIILLASYVLIAHGNEGPQVREAFKFVVLNLVASTLFLASAGLMYGVFGSLNLADLAVRIASSPEYRPQATILGTMLLLTFGIKAALFPLFFWLPDAYPKAPPGIAAYFSGILTKVGVYCLYRVFTLLFRDPEVFANWFQPIILGIAAATMLAGVLCALGQWTMRRILSFHIISQIGYMIFGLGIFTPLALASGIFYIIHHIIVKASLFLVADSVRINMGNDDLKRIAGLMQLSPVLAILFLLAGLSLSGIPPLSGFYGKYGLVVEGFSEGYYFYVFVSLLTSLFTLMSMMKIFRYAFWRRAPEWMPDRLHVRGVVTATGLLVAVSVAVAIGSAWLMGLAVETANQMLDNDVYITAVLGARDAVALSVEQGATLP